MAGTAKCSAAPTLTSETSSARPATRKARSHRAARYLHHRRIGLATGKAVTALDAARPGWPPSRDPSAAAGLFALLREPGRDQFVPTRLQGERGVFCHTNPWIMIAETLVGRGDAAFDYTSGSPVGSRGAVRPASLRALRLPANDRRQGRAIFRRSQKLVALGHGGLELRRRQQWILGIRAEHDGLRIDPCLRRAGRACGHAQLPRRELRDPREQAKGRLRGVSLVVVDGKE